MKKFLLAASALFLMTAASQAQTTQSESQVQKHHRGAFSHHNGMQNLNLSDTQKKQMKDLRESYHKQIADLQNDKSLSADQLKEKTQTLRKEQFSKMQSFLTPEQKTQMASLRAGGANRDFGRGQRFEQMQAQLGLTADQAAKLKASREDFHKKAEAIRADNSLTDAQKKDQVKALAKQHHESLKSVLTPDQLAKLKAGRKMKNNAKA